MDKEVYFHLNRIFNGSCGKDVHPDTMRKWVKAKMHELVEMLNGNPRRAYYNEETLQILVEKYYVEQAELLKGQEPVAGKGRAKAQAGKKHA
jgi:hypothetical protein